VQLQYHPVVIPTLISDHRSGDRFFMKRNTPGLSLHQPQNRKCLLRSISCWIGIRYLRNQPLVKALDFKNISFYTVFRYSKNQPLLQALGSRPSHICLRQQPLPIFVSTTIFSPASWITSKTLNMSSHTTSLPLLSWPTSESTIQCKHNVRNTGLQYQEVGERNWCCYNWY
jgi:hypothetical protein